jgi:hypothetical protein
VHFRRIPLERTRNTPEDGSSIPAGAFSDFSDDLQPFPAGKHRELAGIRRKKIRPEYCFHFWCFPTGYGDFSARFLQDTIAGIFVLGS